MRLLAAAVVLALGLSVSACEEEATSSDPSPERTTDSELPANLCELVAPAVSDEWGLEEVNHSDDGATSTCTLRAGDTHLVATFTEVPADQLDAAFVEACSDFVHTQPEADAIRCIRTDERGGEPTGTVVQAARVPGRDGVLVVTMQTSDRGRADLVGAEVSSVEAALAFA